MRPAALSITITLQEPRQGWAYVARSRGEIIAASDDEHFDNPGRALVAAVADVKAAMPKREAADDEEDEA